MTSALRALLYVHLSCAAAATVLFWTAASVRKGGGVHRLAGSWFSRLVYGTAATGAIMASSRLLRPSLIQEGSGLSSSMAVPLLAHEQHMMWLVLYVLLIIVSPVQHGLAVIAAGPAPARVHSGMHATLSYACMLASLAILTAAVAWGEWLFLIVGPLGLVIGLRQLAYVRRPHAGRAEWQREHLTSLITAGVTLHTALLVFGTTRTLSLEPGGPAMLLPWVIPALIGLPAAVWLRRRRSSVTSE